MSQSDLISLIAGASGLILSLVVAYYKPLAEKFYAIPANFRGLANFGMNVLAALVVFGISCSQLFNLVACTSQSAIDLVKVLAIMFVTNQVTYASAPTSPTKLRLAAIVEAKEAKAVETKTVEKVVEVTTAEKEIVAKTVKVVKAPAVEKVVEVVVPVVKSAEADK